MNVNETIEKVVKTNLEDAERLISIFTETGDTENLQRAKADREKWTEKLRTIREGQRG